MSSFIRQRIVTLKTVVIDGTKMKANASKKSFKGKKKINRLKEETSLYIKHLRNELDRDPAASHRRYEASRLSAKERVQAKVEAALAELPKVEAAKEATKTKVKKGTKAKEAKASLSDPEARLMKFADKSVKAGYNCQIVMSPQNYIVLGAEVTQRGNDSGLLKPMIEQIESRYGERPDRTLVDSSYRFKQDIIDLAEANQPTLVYSPLPKKKETLKEASRRKRQKKEANYPEVLRAFYRRMENRISQKYYKTRSRIETLNGILHNRMPRGFQLRGINKVKAELLLQIISHNILSVFRLNAATA